MLQSPHFLYRVERSADVEPDGLVTLDGWEIPSKVTPMTLPDIPGGRPLKLEARIKGMPVRKRTVTIAKGKRRKVKFDFTGG